LGTQKPIICINEYGKQTIFITNSEYCHAVRDTKLLIYSRLPTSSTKVMSTGHIHWIFKYRNTAHTNVTLEMKMNNDLNRVILGRENNTFILLISLKAKN
jgi:hypothetical protein